MFIKKKKKSMIVPKTAEKSNVDGNGTMKIEADLK